MGGVFGAAHLREQLPEISSPGSAIPRAATAAKASGSRDGTDGFYNQSGDSCTGLRFQHVHERRVPSGQSNVARGRNAADDEGGRGDRGEFEGGSGIGNPLWEMRYSVDNLPRTHIPAARSPPFQWEYLALEGRGDSGGPGFESQFEFPEYV